MATDSVKKVQEKLFRGGVVDPLQFPDKEPGLTINIPKPPPTPTPPPKNAKQPDASPRNAEDAEPRSYRERLAQKLGGDYKGAEKYRLQQDEARDKHWKRWGPYLSDRQWVGTTSD